MEALTIGQAVKGRYGNVNYTGVLTDFDYGYIIKVDVPFEHRGSVRDMIFVSVDQALEATHTSIRAA